MPIWGSKPEKEEERPKRQKSYGNYVKTPTPSPSESKFYLLSQEVDIATPLGTVEAFPGDIIWAGSSGLWVLAAEVLNSLGVTIKPKT